jgi:hypothetical protein
MVSRKILDTMSIMGRVLQKHHVQNGLQLLLENWGGPTPINRGTTTGCKWLENYGRGPTLKGHRGPRLTLYCLIWTVMVV